ncbi:chromosomal replication initiator protein dnaA [Bdellovibrio bacteriovorus HD100]|uniref:Chromosomal replication initiator protein DnaA n=2 Tax=Bdellovibrio bacteriovorus TaxID=959 RepID=DNAA_BDEBA|nr:chromosomal replication initiator protein DnaA [Bdellovibrio bacteriovorus]Q6MRS1.1 RecName: Full=Chromosomal replication initiator protein DnaA [Bdellovibrio bacteriovorus HD100]CAE77685.1 chromosomal replication initiator protein dnaA [Bdellovibrio bacteriovorus HD100]
MELNSSFWTLIKTKMKSRNDNNKLLDTWLDPIEYVSTTGSADRPRLVLGVPNALHQYFVIENLQDKIYTEISDTYGKPFEVEFSITGNKINSHIETSTTPDEVLSGSEILQAQLARAQNIQPTQPRSSSDTLNSELTFSTFVVGKNSEFAHAACYNVARNPGADDYNPLYIYGPVGMGKTHLLHAAGNHIREQYQHLRITYISAERFMNECISAIRRHEMDKFRQKYRENSDILLVDDVQFIARGEAVQEEFFHTVNSFIDSRKQVILASDRMPKDIHGLEDRSRTRLERGLIADITMPDLETRIAILRYKAEKYNVRLPEDVVNYIARISKRSIRELEGNLKKVKMFSELQGLPIDHELVKRILAHHETQSTISVEEIMKLVADHFKVRVLDLKSSTRAKPIVVPRQIAMYLIKKFLDKSLVDIGKSFGGKDHTTVMNALERVKNLQAADQDIAKDIEDLEQRIHNITRV